MIALGCGVLAAGMLCRPGPVGAARLARRSPGRRPQRWRSWAVGSVLIGGLVGLLVGGPAGAGTGLLVALVARRRRAARAAREAGARATGQLADALQRITDELRAGSHPAAALAGCGADGPLAEAMLAPAAAAAGLGDDVPAAFRHTAAGLPGVAEDLAHVGSTWALAERHGIPLADVLGDVHAAIRWRLRFTAGVHAQLAGPRATATVLTVLPLLGIGLGQLMGADPIGTLRGGVLGQALLVVGIGLVTAGNAWTERILVQAMGGR